MRKGTEIGLITGLALTLWILILSTLSMMWFAVQLGVWEDGVMNAIGFILIRTVGVIGVASAIASVVIVIIALFTLVGGTLSCLLNLPEDQDEEDVE